jgi:hypothetical protein
MTHQDVDDASVPPDLLDQIPADVPVEIVVGDGAYDTKHAHTVIVARGAQPSIPPREVRCHGQRTWLAQRDHRRDRQRRPLLMEEVQRLPPALACRESMYRLKTLTGNRLWARRIGSQATEVAIRVVMFSRMTALARPQSVRIT